VFIHSKKYYIMTGWIISINQKQTALYLYRPLEHFFLNKAADGISRQKVGDCRVPEMNEREILDELLHLLEEGGVKIRSEPLGGSGGGLCTVKGEHLFFVDTQASSGDTAALCAAAVAGLIDTETVYIKPQIRQFIERAAGKNP
jgi:hypothetical protein